MFGFNWGRHALRDQVLEQLIDLTPQVMTGGRTWAQADPLKIKEMVHRQLLVDAEPGGHAQVGRHYDQVFDESWQRIQDILGMGWYETLTHEELDQERAKVYSAA